MSLSIELFRYGAAANLSRYRVGGLTRVVVVENFAMTVQSGFIVAGLLILEGILVVRP